MTDLSLLRVAAMERAGNTCEWPRCFSTDRLQLAHLLHRGMGGSEAANTLGNVAILCGWHHDILDGRTVKGRRAEVATLLGSFLIGRRWGR